MRISSASLPQMSAKIALIFGYGPNVGVALAQALAARHYRVAVVSRTDKHAESARGCLQIQADLSDPRSVEPIFSRVVKELGHPNVVIYNGAFLLSASLLRLA